jgi:hypothetical protein
MVKAANELERTERRAAPLMDNQRESLGEEPILIAPAAGHLPDSCRVAFIRVALNLLRTWLS